MQIKQKITPAILAAATGMLQPFIPELTPQGLLAALKSHDAGQPAASIAEKPLTRKEAAALLSVSLNSVNRYMNTGLLRRVKIGPRVVRIDPASVRELLDNGTAEKEA
ncbi:helix-turn-helix domain-containing protein [uncultured Victivallis sp.]|uniref:helix-turn-helix transcriptional regulator n=1 Tax=uncultured Victivallis sp. TaxID=354118 RepID=UPI0025FB1643|nr:helix-turn-helix domain-containing protein [uncultured Victivallis sp.]